MTKIAEYEIDTFATVADLAFPSYFAHHGGRLFLSTEVSDAVGIPHEAILAFVKESHTGRTFFKEHTAKNTINGCDQLVLTSSAVMLLLMSIETYDCHPQLIESVIQEFNKLEDQIKGRCKKERADTLAVIEDRGLVFLRLCVREDVDYSNEADMINRIVLGMSAKAFREEVGLSKGESIRPFLTQEQIDLVEELQRVDIGLITVGMSFDERKVKLLAVAQKRRLKQQIALVGKGRLGVV